MYYLMNKNNIVAVFDKKGSSDKTDASFVMSEIRGPMPIGFQNINAFINGRKASSHNKHLKAIMRRYNCDDPIGFIRVTHAASINDTFWVKSSYDRTKWEDISLYQNPFSEVISKLAFEGVGLYEDVFSPTSPELVTDGSYPKCFTRENDGIYIYKRGSDGAINAGKEPYCEHMASEIASIVCKNAVHYDLVKFHDKIASKCKLFTDEKNGYASCAKAFGKEKLSFEEELSLYSKIGSEEAYREMIVLDAVIFNEDRHRGNYGVIFDTETMQIKEMAPVFDLNMSLLFSFMPEDFEHLGDSLLEHGPKIGNDFLQIGQAAITDNIKDRIKDLKDFQFSFRGDDLFTSKRVDALENIVHKQAEALLSKQRLFTKDIFIPEHPDFSEEKTKIIQNELLPIAEEICNKIDQIPGYFASIENSGDKIIIYLEEEIPQKDISFQIDVLNEDICCLICGNKTDLDKNNDAYKVFNACFDAYKEAFPKEKRAEFFEKYKDEIVLDKKKEESFGEEESSEELCENEDFLIDI
ncbi:MAG: hypothetical protein K6E47_14785 [Lachnospiraceae bacterium]|nr:hypothetical protein [Lachnospiraceae bacterium]